MTFGGRPDDQGGATGRAVALLAVASAGLAGCITLVFLAMRAVMDIGGACASGGPFVPVQPCPDGVPLLLMLGVSGLFGFGALGFVAGARVGGGWVALPFLAWPGLFLSLGWNFLEYGFWPPGGGGWEWGWLIPGVLFVVMGGVPLLVAMVARREFADRAPDGGGVVSSFGLGSVAGPQVRLSYGPPGVSTSTVSARPASGSGRGTTGGGDIVGRLERLAGLRRSGDLTDDEFDVAKAALLAGASSAAPVDGDAVVAGDAVAVAGDVAEAP